MMENHSPEGEQQRLQERLDRLPESERGSYKDLWRTLSNAIANQPVDGGKLDAWLSDFDEDCAVYYSGSKTFQVPYTLNDDGSVSLGTPVEVQQETSYQPVQSNAQPPAGEKAQKNWATPKRAGFTSLLERPAPHDAQIQVRMDAAGGSDATTATFRGYASTTEQAYHVRDWLGEYDETIRAGGFAKTLRERPDVPMLRNHDENFVLANTSSGTSQLSEDGHGLLNGADFDLRMTYVSDLCISMRRGDIGKMSFSYAAVKEAWNDDYTERSVSELKLYDTSVVTFPANAGTSADLVEEMRSALGREGRSLWLADSEMSIRSALPVFVEGRQDEGTDDLLERALRSLVHADEVMLRHRGPHGRARTFMVARSLLAVRAGKVLSGANQTLLQSALDSLASADKSHQKSGAARGKAADAVQQVLGSAGGDPDGDDDADGSARSDPSAVDGKTPAAKKGKKGKKGVGKSSGDGKANGTPPGAGNPINPADGAGPRAFNPAAIAQQREREIALIRRSAR